MVDKDKQATKDEIRQLDGILPEGIDRRKFLAGSVASLFGGLAGCAGGEGDQGGNATGQNQTTTDQQSDEEKIIKNTIFRNAWKAEPHYSVAYMAVQQGYWADENIAPPNVRAGFGSDDTAKRVGNGREMFGFASFGAQVPALGQGLDLKLFGTGRAMTQLALIYRKDRMNSGTDLANKTVITQDPYGRSIWPLFADTVDAPDSVKTKYAEEAAAAALLNKGEGDAVWGFFADLGSFEENVDAELGVEPLYNHLPIVGYPLITYGPWLEKSNNKEYTARLLEGYSHAGKWTVLHPEETVEIMKNEVNTALQATEDSVLMDTLKAGVGAVNLSEGVQNNGFAYLDQEVLATSLDSVGEALDVGNLPSAEEVGAWDIQEQAELAQFSSDEWNQVKEWAQPYTDLLLE